MKKLKKVIAWTIVSILSLLLVIYIAFQVSPKPSVWIVSSVFNSKVEIQDSSAYRSALNKIEVVSNVRYTSMHKMNSLDVYYPKNGKNLPILFWVQGVQEFAAYVAASGNVAVILVDYQKAPDLRYPGQIKQLDEAVRYILSQKREYPMFDFRRIGLGGDSAGGQISAQYILTQTSAVYAKELTMEQTIDPEIIQAFINYCGPLDLKQSLENKTDNKFMKFFVSTVGWSWLGKKDWYDSPELDQASLVGHLTADFPPSFITDGNNASFAEQAISFKDRLQELSVPTVSLFFENKDKEVNHEYQFLYKTPEAKECLRLTLEFIEDYLVNPLSEIN